MLNNRTGIAASINTLSCSFGLIVTPVCIIILVVRRLFACEYEYNLPHHLEHAVDLALVIHRFRFFNFTRVMSTNRRRTVHVSPTLRYRR